MAIALEDKPNTVPPGGSYPYGDIQDDDGSNNGTPVNTEVYGDFHQFFAALMAAASMAFNGLRDNATNSFQYLDALAKFVRLLSASETESGTAPIATQALTNAGVSDATIVTPLKLKTTPEVMGVDGSSKVRTKVLNIGDWNMDSDGSKVVAHGVTNFKNIRSVAVIIRNDADTAYYDLNLSSIITGSKDGTVQAIESTDITLGRTNSGGFDNSNFDSTSYNRGFITITYLP